MSFDPFFFQNPLFLGLTSNYMFVYASLHGNTENSSKVAVVASARIAPQSKEHISKTQSNVYWSRTMLAMSSASDQSSNVRWSGPCSTYAFFDA